MPAEPAVLFKTDADADRALCAGGNFEEMAKFGELDKPGREDFLYRPVAARPRQALRFFRRAVCQSQTMTLATHLDRVASHMAVLEDTPEHRAGIAALRNRPRKS